MIIDKQGSIVLISQEKKNFPEFLKLFIASLPKFTHEHIILNLFSTENMPLSYLLELLPISDQHRKTKHSFVIVSDKVNIDQVPEELMVVPSLQEAYDLIEMEEIERDLDL